MPSNAITTSAGLVDDNYEFINKVRRHTKDNKTGVLSNTEVSSSSGFIL